MTSSATRPGNTNLPSGASCSPLPSVPPLSWTIISTFLPLISPVSFPVSSYLICSSFDLHSYIFPCVNPFSPLHPFFCLYSCLLSFGYLFFHQLSFQHQIRKFFFKQFSLRCRVQTPLSNDASILLQASKQFLHHHVLFHYSKPQIAKLNNNNMNPSLIIETILCQ